MLHIYIYIKRNNVHKLIDKKILVDVDRQNMVKITCSKYDGSFSLPDAIKLKSVLLTMRVF